MEKFKNPLIISIAAMLVAIATVLGFFKVPVNQFIELRFAFLPIATSGMLFGPGVGAIVGILSDILGFLVKPTGPFFPGFTISSAVAGTIYGICLYKKPVTIPRVLVTMLLQTLIVNLGLNTLNLSILYGAGFIAVLVPRLLQNLIMYPIHCIMLFVLLRAIKPISARFLADTE